MSAANQRDELTPDQRLTEAAAILAAGVLRLRKRHALAASSPGQKVPQSSPIALEPVAASRPDGPAGLRSRDKETRR